MRGSGHKGNIVLGMLSILAGLLQTSDGFLELLNSLFESYVD